MPTPADFMKAFYAGIPGQKAPPTDAAKLREIANWMDRCDDIADQIVGRSARPEYREMQTALREIAAKIEP